MKLFFKLIFFIILFQTNFSFATSLTFNDNKIISYTDSGFGKNNLILIHAFPTDKNLWKPQIENLKNNFRVITLDLWGFGKSSSTNGKEILMSDYADEIKTLMNKLHIEKAIIGGESMGGYIALAFLERYPNNVNGLILSDTQTLADNQETKIKREQTAVDVLQHGSKNLIDTFMTKALSSYASQEIKNNLLNILNAQSQTGIASALRGMALRQDTSNTLTNSKLPILILTGKDDALISPQQSENMHALAKASKLVVIDHAGHLSNLEQSKEWNEAVINMFAN